jgi:pimeloyl-ACP methyl ester carboxylesterase
VNTRGRYTEIDGASAFIESAGEGDPVICLHTAGQSGAQWLDVLRGMSGDFNVIAPDLPGHGRSELLPNGPVQDLTVYRDWVIAMIAELGLDAPFLVGCSIGARISLDIAGSLGDNARGVIAMEANSRPLPQRGLQKELLDSTSPSRADRTFYGTLISVGRNVPADRAERIGIAHRREDPTVSTADLLGWANHDLNGRLGEIRCPVRLVAGQDDFWLDPEQLAPMAAEIPDATTEILTGVGHYPMEEIPNFPEVLSGWLEEMRRSERG